MLAPTSSPAYNRCHFVEWMEQTEQYRQVRGLLVPTQVFKGVHRILVNI
jgi:RecB family endonuclease NucS